MTAALIAPVKRAVTAADLIPGRGLTASPDSTSWMIGEPNVRFSAETPLDPGWYELRLALRSADRFTVRKRIEVSFTATEQNARPVTREAFAWNRTLGETFVLQLPDPAAGVRLELWDAQGTLTLEQFDVRRVTAPGVIARAVREKVRLTRAYHCFGPALARGGRLLLRGQFREFGTKLIKGLTDARILAYGGNGEADAAWWRRNALPTAEVEEVRRAVEAMTDTPPVAVLLPVDPDRLDVARVSVLSVRRQIYPHWELYAVSAGPAGLTPHLYDLVGPDRRCKVVRVPTSSGLPVGVAKAVGGTRCEHVVVLPPGVELADHALFHLIDAARSTPTAVAIGGQVSDPLGEPKEDAEDQTHVWLTKTRSLRDAVPHRLTPMSAGKWIAGTVPAASKQILDKVLAYPPDDGALILRLRKESGGRPLIVSGDLHGLSGYDHVVYALLKGLPTAGATLRLHPAALVKPELLPPGATPPVGRWLPGDKQIVVTLPWLDARFPIDGNTAMVTMWETDRLLPEWVDRLNRAGVVIVPSRWGAECFRNCGLTVPIEVAPLGYDPLVFHPNPHTAPNGPCTFGTAGALASGGVRKNAQRVIDVFRAAFPTERDVRLRVKITPSSPSVETYDDPRVEVMRAILPTAELAEWYRSLTAYVNGSAGEGFGLHLIEAMACGRPLISAPYSGLTEFFDPAVGYPVDYRLVPVRNEVYTGNWAETDNASMSAQMRRVYTERAEAERLGSAAAARAKGFTWKASGRAYIRALRKHGFLEG